MPIPNMIILYVDNPTASAAFYQNLLGAVPVESSPTFAMFVVAGAPAFGLWSRHTVEPAASTAGGGAEVAFRVADASTVDAVHAAWAGLGLAMLQAPVQMDFGRTFVALDPDGHRLRVFAPGAA